VIFLPEVEIAFAENALPDPEIAADRLRRWSRSGKRRTLWCPHGAGAGGRRPDAGRAS